MLGRLGGETHR